MKVLLDAAAARHGQVAAVAPRSVAAGVDVAGA
jgi:hypothetical protein